MQCQQHDSPSTIFLAWPCKQSSEQRLRGIGTFGRNCTSGGEETLYLCTISNFGSTVSVSLLVPQTLSAKQVERHHKELPSNLYKYLTFIKYTFKVLTYNGHIAGNGHNNLPCRLRQLFFRRVPLKYILVRILLTIQLMSHYLFNR